MTENVNFFLSSSSSRHQPSFYWAVLFVVSMHLGLLGLSKHWNPAPPKPKEKQKVIVQTIRLDAPRSSSTPIRTAPPVPAPVAPVQEDPPQAMPAAEIPKPVEQISEELTMVEEISPPTEEPVEEKPIEKEEEAPLKEATPPAPPAPKPSVTPAKKESKPQPKPAPKKTAAKETKKPVVKSAPPAKKEVAKPKKTPKKEPAKKTEKSETDKKAQKEKIEADKKRQQEKTEADKKKQKEKAEAEKKRQQEIAAAEQVVRQKEQALLSKAKENLAKMGETRDKISTSPSINLETTALPKELGTLQVDALPIDGPGEAGGNWGTKEVSYSGEVASRLKKALRLPDYGAVKIKLTLNKTGKVVNVEIEQSESSINKAYVESKIPTLLFPPFGQRFNDASQHTFVITLQNDS